jgi:hypothetical protein
MRSTRLGHDDESEVLSMNNDFNWSSRRPIHRTLAIFAVAVSVAIIAAFATTIQRVDTRQASSDMPPGTIGLAHPHPPLDRAPGEALNTRPGKTP